jgi:hypothetical protein
MYWFNGTDWVAAQEKTSVNQAPLFDLFDSDKISLTDSTVYPGSTFAGNKIFSYKVSTTGTNDIVLGFPLTYRNINNIGDIVFTFDLLQNQFSYKQGVDVLTKKTDAQYLKLITGLDTGLITSSANETVTINYTYNMNGCSVTATKTVTIESPVISGLATVAAGEQITLTATTLPAFGPVMI